LRRSAAGQTPPPKVAVVLAAFPGTPNRLPSPGKSSMLRAFECADAIWRAAAVRHVSLEFFLDNGRSERRRQIVSQVLVLRPDGVIALRRLVSHVPLQAMLRPLIEASLPVVTVFDDCEGLPVHSVNENNIALGYQAARRFLTLGHRRLAVLLPAHGGDYFDDRAVGCEQAWCEANLPIENLRIVRLPLNRPFAPPLRKLFAPRDARPTAVFSSTATFLPELLRTLKQLRLAVPRDVSVLMTASVTQTSEMARPPASGFPSWMWGSRSAAGDPGRCCGRRH
jgi:DNA-binding LacI/PurR family transcriptional regulator